MKALGKLVKLASPLQIKSVTSVVVMAVTLFTSCVALADIPQSVRQSCMVCHGQIGENTIYPRLLVVSSG